LSEPGPEVRARKDECDSRELPSLEALKVNLLTDRETQ
jgi:hypothetical protein